MCRVKAVFPFDFFFLCLFQNFSVLFKFRLELFLINNNVKSKIFIISCSREVMHRFMLSSQQNLNGYFVMEMRLRLLSKKQNHVIRRTNCSFFFLFKKILDQFVQNNYIGIFLSDEM